MSISCAVLMCHAPIVVPAIAGNQADACRATTVAMESAARALIAHEPHLVVLISPHAPRKPTSMGLVFESQLAGDFSRFGHEELALAFAGAPAAAALIEKHARARGVATHALSGHGLDHGATVPLFFLREAGYRGRVVVVALPYPAEERSSWPKLDLEAEFGRALADAAKESGERWALLASGDMSHRLTRDAPAGFEPRAREFDAAFVEAIGRGDLRDAVTPDSGLAKLAAEDVVQSTAVAAAAVEYLGRGTRVLSYEAPFGVGYLEALLYSRHAPMLVPETTETPSPPPELVDVALSAIAHALRGEPYEPPSLPPPWDAPHAVFVTLRSPAGELRGCIGRTEPSLPSLAHEVADCAVGAATRDPRMERVQLAELASLQVDVSILHDAEPVVRASDLDPAAYGVMVEHGARRGVLLPAIEGVTTAAQQLEVALRKAGIDARSPYTLHRFRVDKVSRK